MHWDIIGKPRNKFETDHINGDRLDNRKINLRICTRSQNNMNKGIQKNNNSGFKGVVFFKGKWMAHIQINNRNIYLGVFDNIKDAAQAYNEAAIRYHKRFAVLNKIDNK